MDPLDLEVGAHTQEPFSVAGQFGPLMAAEESLVGGDGLALDDNLDALGTDEQIDGHAVAIEGHGRAVALHRDEAGSADGSGLIAVEFVRDARQGTELYALISDGLTQATRAATAEASRPP